MLVWRGSSCRELKFSQGQGPFQLSSSPNHHRLKVLHRSMEKSHWWASSSDMLIYPSIFTFPLLPLHCQSTSTHPCTDGTTHNHTHTHFIGPTSLIWWTHDLQFTWFTSILSIPNVCPPAVWPIMSPRTMQSGTFYSFALDEPYALFLVCHSYLTYLYLPFAHRRANQLPIWVSPSRIEI